MTESWRRLALAAVLNLTVGVGVGMAQTVIVKSAPSAAHVWLVFNSNQVGSATADANGNATIDLSRLPAMQKVDTDVHLFVDACDKDRRIILIERGLQPQEPDASCTRQEIVGWFSFRRGTSLLADMSAAVPTFWLRQGQVPAQWLRQGEEGRPMSKEMPVTPTGLVVFGGGGIQLIGNFTTDACGAVSTCDGRSLRLGLSAGASVWFTQYFGVEATYYRPMRVKVSGSDTDLNFSGYMDSHIITIAGKAGYPFGPARIYGKAGIAYNRTTTSSTSTLNDRTTSTTVTTANPDGSSTVTTVTTFEPGGTLTIASETEGWGYMFGGGLELWAKPSVAAYIEGGRLRLKGKAFDNSDATLDDSTTFVVVGVRIHIGRAPAGR